MYDIINESRYCSRDKYRCNTQKIDSKMVGRYR